MEKPKRTKPLVAVASIWDPDSVSEYAETVRIPMEDGHVVNYRIDVPQPCFIKVMDILKGMPMYVGYRYRGPKETKKRRRL